MFGTCVRWEVEFIGMRSGEKLHENLITVEERNHCLPSDCSTHFKIQKEQAVFSYPKLWDSSQNTFLLIKEIRKELKENDLM
jgi:FlaA1/EpsC-like NDP-sugar epimerase